jgi:beta-lactamase class A
VSVGGHRRKIRMFGLAAVALAGCIPQAHSAQPPSRYAIAEHAAAQDELEARIRELGRGFDGEVGIAVRDIETGWATDWHGDRFYPQQTPARSTSMSASL